MRTQREGAYLTQWPPQSRFAEHAGFDITNVFLWDELAEPPRPSEMKGPRVQ